MIIQDLDLNQYNSILWDFNGTLLNDVELCIELANQLLTEENLPTLTTQTYKQQFGFPISAYYQRIGFDFDKRSMESLTVPFIKGYMKAVRSCALHDGITHLLEQFAKAEKKQYVLTAARTENAKELLGDFGLLDYFIEVAGLDNDRAESKVETGKELLKRHQIDAQKTVLFGDTLHDFEVAKALGVDCILIAHGHQSKARLESGVQAEALVVESVAALVASL